MSATTPVEVDLQPVKSDVVPVESRPVAWKRPAGYAAVGVGGALVLTAAYMSLWSATGGFSNDKVEEFKRSVPKDRKVCDEARRPSGPFQESQPSRGDVVSLCDRGDTFKTVQTVLYPIGGLLVAGGAYLLYSASKGGDASSDGAATAKRRVEVMPMVGQQSGFVDVRVSF
ncbi:MAG: hypothetical protein EOO75_17270 [Myxococcales bacterium]|nr:MAG: hypothetical protein EOO75_17270 [Myxococcales bacterium]